MVYMFRQQQRGLSPLFANISGKEGCFLFVYHWQLPSSASYREDPCQSTTRKQKHHHGRFGVGKFANSLPFLPYRLFAQVPYRILAMPS